MQVLGAILGQPPSVVRFSAENKGDCPRRVAKVTQQLEADREEYTWKDGRKRRSRTGS